MSTVPKNPLGTEIAAVLTRELDELLVGAAADLQAAAARIAANALEAAATGEQALVDECVAQSRVLLEEHRLRAVDGSWTAVSAVIGGVIRTLAVFASTAGGAA